MLSRKMPSQKLLVKEQVSNVELINPNASVEKSLQFMKQLSIVAISTITFLRDVFPSDAFEEKKLADQKVYVLHGNEDIPGTTILVKWIKSAFELIQSHHLKKMILVIHKGQTALESYTFAFSYNDEAILYDVLGQVDGQEVVLSQSQGLPEDIAKSVRQLIRYILAHTSSLKPLPDGCGLSLKIHVDDNTPEAAVPEFFEPSSADDEVSFPEKPETLKLGKIESKYTTFSVSTKIITNENYNDGVNQDENVAVNQDENGAVHQDENLAVNQDENMAPLEDWEDEVMSSQNPPLKLSSFTSNSSQMGRSQIGNKQPDNDSITTNLSEKLSIVSLKEKTVNCICECSDQLDDPIKCVLCSTFQHKACYKFLDSHSVTSHVCVNCHDPNVGITCSASELLNDPNRKESALYRQALMYCCNSVQVSCKRIETHLKVPRRVAEKIMRQLDADGCLELATNKGQVRIVKPDFQNTILGQHFSAPSSDSTCMDIIQSPRNASSSAKRQLSQLKENISPELQSPQPKRGRIAKTLKKNSCLKSITE